MAVLVSLRNDIHLVEGWGRVHVGRAGDVDAVGHHTAGSVDKVDRRGILLGGP